MLVIEGKIKKIEEMKTETKFVFSTKLPVDPLQVESVREFEGFATFTPDPLTTKAIEIIKDRTIGIKVDNMRPSQRLRFAIWNRFIKNHPESINSDNQNEEFEKYYSNFIQYYIDQLERDQ